MSLGGDFDLRKRLIFKEIVLSLNRFAFKVNNTCIQR